MKTIKVTQNFITSLHATLFANRCEFYLVFTSYYLAVNILIDSSIPRYIWGGFMVDLQIPNYFTSQIPIFLPLKYPKNITPQIPILFTPQIP